MKILGYVQNFLSLAIIGIFGWAFQINSRVAVLETKEDSIKDLLTTRFNNVDERLARIERNQDKE